MCVMKPLGTGRQTRSETQANIQPPAKAKAAYMETGARFNTLSMIILREDIDKIGAGRT